MPVLHEYRNKRGMYVKARHGNGMVTYQLAPAAVAELHRQSMGEGSQISPDVLRGFVSAGLAYTHGSGAGVIDNPELILPTNSTITVRVTLSIEVGEPPTPRKRKQKKQRRQPSGARLYPASCCDEARPALPPPSRPFTPPALLPTPPLPDLAASPAQSVDRLYPASCYADYQDSTPEHRPLVARPNPLALFTAPAVPSSLYCRPAAAPVEVTAEPFDQADIAPTLIGAGKKAPVEMAAEPFELWRVADRLWATIVSEFFGIPVWLWLLMAIGVLVPVLVIGSLVGRR